MPVLPSQYHIVTILSHLRKQYGTPNFHIPTLNRDDEDQFFKALTDGWSSVFVAVFISFPWLIISVFDAIDSKYRTSSKVAFRLALASLFLVCAYTLGILFVIGLIRQTKLEEGRYDEVATIFVLLIFNSWHVGRNIRGWTQFIAIRKIKPVFLILQTRFANTFPSQGRSSIESNHGFQNNQDNSKPRLKKDKNNTGPQKDVDLNHPQFCTQGLERLVISNRLIDNDLRGPTPFLSPFFRLKPSLIALYPTFEEDAWAVAIWRAWWTQDTSNSSVEDPTLTAPINYHCDKAHRRPNVEDLMKSEPSGLNGEYTVHNQTTNAVITNKREWAEALLTYGGNEGQQDTHGEALPVVASIYNASGIALLIKEKTSHLPHRMSALWYTTARFEELYDEKAFDLTMRTDNQQIMFPKWAGWLRIARDISDDRLTEISATDRTLVLLAGELASTSLILVRYPAKYQELVNQIYEDGLNARWTFGWSGLLACFSHLWTKDRIYIAMLNGLSLLALNLCTEVKGIDPNVRAMLYGYAAFAVSDRGVGRQIAQDRRDELDRRYAKNKGKTCRGSGLHAIRIACRALELPAEASHMDGLPAFSTGWAGEFLERKPGNQEPEHGGNHDQVEAKQGSSNAFRYPYSHS